MHTLYIDERKVDGYSMIVVPLETGPATLLRKALAGLRLNGQSRLHMVKENDRRRRLVLSTIGESGAEAVIHSTKRMADGPARHLWSPTFASWPSAGWLAGSWQLAAGWWRADPG